MEEYMLVLKNPDKQPNQLIIPAIIGPRVPVKEEIIESGNMIDYIKKIAEDKNEPQYVPNFAYSNYVVTEVRHIPFFNKTGKLESIAEVHALRIYSLK